MKKYIFLILLSSFVITTTYSQKTDWADINEAIERYDEGSFGEVIIKSQKLLNNQIKTKNRSFKIIVKNIFSNRPR